jgi:hypothetical protein
MNLVTCQHEWVEQCQLRYRVDPPSGYHWEEAHYPLSRQLGGCETVRLWYPDHIVQGALQTLEHGYPCMDTRKERSERAILQSVYPEYLQVYEEAYYLCKSYAGVLRGKVTGPITVKNKTGIHSQEYKTSEKYIKDKQKAGRALVEKGEGIHARTFEEMSAQGKKNGKTTMSQVWESLIDGYRSNAPTVARHNRDRGWDPNARARIE